MCNLQLTISRSLKYRAYMCCSKRKFASLVRLQGVNDILRFYSAASSRPKYQKSSTGDFLVMVSRPIKYCNDMLCSVLYNFIHHKFHNTEILSFESHDVVFIYYSILYLMIAQQLWKYRQKQQKSADHCNVWLGHCTYPCCSRMSSLHLNWLLSERPSLLARLHYATLTPLQ